MLPQIFDVNDSGMLDLQTWCTTWCRYPSLPAYQHCYASSPQTNPTHLLSKMAWSSLPAEVCLSAYFFFKANLLSRPPPILNPTHPSFHFSLWLLNLVALSQLPVNLIYLSFCMVCSLPTSSLTTSNFTPNFTHFLGRLEIEDMEVHLWIKIHQCYYWVWQTKQSFCMSAKCCVTSSH